MHRNRQRLTAELLEKVLSTAECRKQHQCCACGFQMLRYPRSKPLGHIARAPGTLAIIAGRSPQKRWIEQDEIKALIPDGPEEIALTHFHPALHTIESYIDARAADRFSVDIDCHDATRMPCGDHGTHSRSGAHIQHFRIAAWESGCQLAGQKLARTRQFRIEDAGHDHE